MATETAKLSDVVTVREALDRAKSEGLPISEYALRGWIKTGALPVRRIGRKVLIFWPNLRTFLACEEGGDIPPLRVEEISGYGNIRRLG